MAKLGNVVQFNNKVDDKNVYGTIHTFLSRKGQNSKNTQGTYERHIRDFFKTMRNKDLDKLVEEDLIFTKKQIKSYQVALKEKYKGSTVNGAITSVRECYKQLEDDGFAVQVSWFNLERYDEHDTRSHDTLTHDEVLTAIALVSKTRKGSEKALLLRLAYATAFRKESLLNLKWNQIVKVDDIWYLKVLGKGNKWSWKKISNSLYDTLMNHKETTSKDKIFELTDKTVGKMIKFINEKMDFGERQIVFHSFKKASIDEVNIISGGDLKAMQAHGDHANASTTINTYVAKKSREELVMVDTNTVIPVEKFDEMSKEELVGLIKSMDRNTIIKLLQKKGDM